MLGENLTFPQDDHAVSMDQRSFTLANVSSPLLTVIPHVGFGSSHVSILICLSWCTI